MDKGGHATIMALQGERIIVTDESHVDKLTMCLGCNTSALELLRSMYIGVLISSSHLPSTSIPTPWRAGWSPQCQNPDLGGLLGRRSCGGTETIRASGAITAQGRVVACDRGKSSRCGVHQPLAQTRRPSVAMVCSLRRWPRSAFHNQAPGGADVTALQQC
jgi:hypothetical protein